MSAHPLRVLIHGPEIGADPEHVTEVLNGLRYAHRNITLLGGTGNGTFRLVLDWAAYRNVEVETFFGDWTGPDRPGLVVVFAGAADEGELIREAVRGAGAVLLPAVAKPADEVLA